MDAGGQLSPEVLGRLARLNTPRYLEFKRDEIAALCDFHLANPSPFPLVEIGSNRGRFAIGLAQGFAPERVLAIEWRRKWVRCLSDDIERLKLKNLVCLRADARIALPIVAPARSVRRLFVLFPDPWWKRRHADRRLLDKPFLQTAAEFLEPGGLLIVKTDVPAIQRHLLDEVAGVDGLSLLPPEDCADEPQWTRSQRERGCVRDGIPIFRTFIIAD